MLRLPLLSLVTVLHASTAYAFTEPRTYYDAASNGGGGNRFFTGSPAEGYGCAVCHTGPGRAWPLEINGLPEGGYEPGETYELVLRFDELSDHIREQREEGEVPAAVGLVAELVAENGIGTGKLEVTPATEAEDGELCVLPRGQRATQLYRVRPGEATRESGLECEAESLGQRCVVATLSCGASELRVRWTAPEDAKSPIWFSGGFVTAERANGDAKNDSVLEFDEVLLPKGSSQDFATTTLKSGCSAAFGRSGSSGGSQAGSLIVWLALLGLLALRRTAGAWTAAVALFAACSLAACSDSDFPRFEESEYGAHPSAGLFTPGNLIGVDWEALDASVDAGDAGRDPAEDALNGGGVCVEREAGGTPGELTIEFQTDTYGGFYEPENCGAVWIEDEEGQYVATPMIWAGLRTRNLFVWDARRCQTDRPDVIASATLTEHGKRHMATWDGLDQLQKVVPDGNYVLNIEVTEDEFDYGEYITVPFEKGPTAFTLEPDDTTSVKNLKLSFTPK
jgi:hypothetical protein